MKIAPFIILLGVASGCATSNIRMSSDICREGSLASYVDEEFAIECQKRPVYTVNAQAPVQVNINTETQNSNWGPAFYGREIISRIRE